MSDSIIIIPIPEDVVISKIHFIRNMKVMLDRDLAALYGVETKRLKEAVRRNIARFPEDFMFEMTKEEFLHWRSHFASSNSDKMGLRYTLFCITEQGVAMLSSILNSDRAIQVNIQIIRIFTKLRALLSSQKEILQKLEQIEKKDIEQDKKIKLIFNYLEQLEKVKQQESDQKKRNNVGFKTHQE
jgi:hypothetical protein